jgi:DeoR/GlpR family transcriptional regulator of sugar metabolism
LRREERLERIAGILGRQSLLTVQDICELFGVSRDTARRDLVLLEEQGRITRTRGGAVSNTVRTFDSRQQDNELTKKKIAGAASEHIKDGDVIFMDTSTTVYYVSDYIADTKVTIVTQSLYIAQHFGHLKHADIFLLGGKLNKDDHFVYGSMVHNMLEHFRADVALLGTCGIYDGETAVRHAEDAMLKRKMMARSDKVLLLADSSKFGVKMPYSVSPLEQIDVLVTDADPVPHLAGPSRPKAIERV